MKKSIIRNLILANFGFGFFMGVVFPIYASFFVTFKPGMFIWFSLGCIVAGSIIGFMNMLFMRLFLLRKLDRIKDVSGHLRESDFTRRVQIESRDSIGDIARSLDTAIADLGTLIAGIKTQSREMLTLSRSAEDATRSAAAKSGETLRSFQQKAEGVAREVQGNIERFEGITREVRDSFARLRENVTQQTRHSEGSLEGLKQLHRRIEGGTEQVRTILDLARTSQEESAHGTERLSFLSGEIKALSDLVQGTATQTMLLQQKTAKVDAIVQDINAVVNQINTLSLNASIEAAKAGVQGRGFAVVAGEIKKLALKTVQAGKDIQEVIGGIQKDSQGFVEAMDVVHQKARVTLERSESIGEALTTTLSTARKTGAQVESLAGELTELHGQSTLLQKQNGVNAEYIAKSRSGMEGVEDMMKDMEGLRWVVQGLSQKTGSMATEARHLDGEIQSILKQVLDRVDRSAKASHDLGERVEGFRVSGHEGAFTPRNQLV